MRAVSFQPPWDRLRDPAARRVARLSLVLAAHLLVLVLLFRPGPPLVFPPDTPKIFRVLSFSDHPEAPKPARRAAPAAAPVKPADPVKPPPPTPLPALNMLILSREDYAASDISKIRSPSPVAAAVGTGQDSETAAGPGAGPGGERLYNAEWYAEPTQAEMAYYLPAGRTQPGWALIACRTVPRYRVEDCQELGESPAGSGLSRALRQAAWQFRVRPPRIGGRPMVGEWVRIRFDFRVEAAK